MKTAKTKIIALFLISIIIASLLVTVSADENIVFIDNNNNSHDMYSCEDNECFHTEYTYENINANKAEQIVKMLNGENTIAPFGIFCIFGHNLQRGEVTQIYHNYYLLTPKCKEVVTDVNYCTRDTCSFFEVLRTSEGLLYCH